MIKRRFYRLEHANGDDASDSSISSSDSEPEVDAAEESQDDVEEVEEDDESCSTSSGYKSEDSSVNEVDVDSSGLPSSTEDDPDIGKKSQTLSGSQVPDQSPLGIQLPDESPLGTLDLQSDILSMKEPLPADIPVCILKCKSVFKCRLCPRVVCLNEETLNAHLKSKRHARSQKLLNEGRLKIMLNDNGEIENPENSTESPPRLPAFPPEYRRRKNKSQQSHGSRAKGSNKKEKKHLNGQMRGSTKNLVKKRRKIE